MATAPKSVIGKLEKKSIRNGTSFSSLNETENEPKNSAVISLRHGIQRFKRRKITIELVCISFLNSATSSSASTYFPFIYVMATEITKQHAE